MMIPMALACSIRSWGLVLWHFNSFFFPSFPFLFISIPLVSPFHLLCTTIPLQSSLIMPFSWAFNFHHTAIHFFPIFHHGFAFMFFIHHAIFPPHLHSATLHSYLPINLFGCPASSALHACHLACFHEFRSCNYGCWQSHQKVPFSSQYFRRIALGSVS